MATDDIKQIIRHEVDFTEVASLSDLKSVPSSSNIDSTGNTSPTLTASNSESDHENIPKKKTIWPKYKRFRDPVTGEEAIYELIEPSSFRKSKGIFTLCTEIVTISSISLFLASNLAAFTVGILIGKRMAYDY